MRWKNFRLAGLAVAPLLLSGLTDGPPAGAVTADACTTWTNQQPVSPAADSNKLMSVSAFGPCDIWAVGSAQDQPLIEHWTDGSWALSPAPVLDSGALKGVSAVSATDVWAVGDTFQGTDFTSLALHWDGSGWTRVPVPGAQGQLMAVDALSASDAWAVGVSENQGVPGRPLALHWDGAQWTQRDLPGTASIQLAAVSAVSDSDVWVVGQQGPTAVTYHWDGSSWSQPPAPSADESLAGITAVSADNVWAVGTASGGPVEPFVMHWDGSSWTRVQVPIPGGSNVSTFLTGIASSSASDVWVSGISLRSPQQPFALHWDGSSWAVVTLVPNLVPVGGLGVAATAVAVSSRGQAWLVGTRSDDQVTWAEPAPVVPDGILTPGNADSTFRQFGLSSGPVSHTTNCPASSVGAIVGVSPAQGQRVPFGTPVGVTVCDAPAPVPVPVPDLFGFDDGTARDTITSLGLSVGPVRMAANCSVSRGDVFSQSPGPGTMLLPGSAVSLTESNGRQGNGRLCPIE